MSKATLKDRDLGKGSSRKTRSEDECPHVDEKPPLSYVAACMHHAWHLRLWKKDDPKKVQKIPYRCGSWRHEGECRLWKGAQDFVRCKEAIEKYDFWCHVVLTFYQPDGADLQEMFLTGKDKWSALRKRFIRNYDTLKYIQTWEVHRTGFPHLHIAISNVNFYESACPSYGDKRERQKVAKENWKRLLQVDAEECGFGKIGWVERLQSKGAMAGYLNKLSRELTGTGPKNQVPVNAPPHFRRLRASQGLLPPIIRNPDISGELVLRPLELSHEVHLSIQE